MATVGELAGEVVDGGAGGRDFGVGFGVFGTEQLQIREAKFLQVVFAGEAGQLDLGVGVF